MGTDIHPIVQYRKNNKWETIIFPDLDHPLRDRNYTLFAALAGVRNGFGFAGCYRHEPLAPIAEDRGLPPDLGEIPLTTMYGEPPDTYWLGDHSYTHLTLTEILSYNWEQELRQGGVMPLEAFKEWRPEYGPPASYSGGVVGINIRTISSEVANGMDFNPEPGIKYYVEIYWVTHLRELCTDFLSLIPWLWQLSAGNPDNIRIVMGFDS